MNIARLHLGVVIDVAQPDGSPEEYFGLGRIDEKHLVSAYILLERSLYAEGNALGLVRWIVQRKGEAVMDAVVAISEIGGVVVANKDGRTLNLSGGEGALLYGANRIGERPSLRRNSQSIALPIGQRSFPQRTLSNTSHPSVDNPRITRVAQRRRRLIPWTGQTRIRQKCLPIRQHRHPFPTVRTAWGIHGHRRKLHVSTTIESD